MKRLAALTLVLGVAAVARHAGDGAPRFATMALGFVLIVATLVGEALEQCRLPRLTGYLLTGLCFGPSVLNLITPGMATQLRLVNGLAVALIAFTAGMELDLTVLRGEWRSIARHGVILLAFLYVGLFAVTLAATPFLRFSEVAPWPRRVAIAAMTAAVLATFSPTVVMAVLAETRARGPVSKRLLSLVILGDLGVVFVFTVAAALAHVLSGAQVRARQTMLHVCWEVFGSVVAGCCVGALFVVYRRFVNQRSGLVLAGACLVMAEGGRQAGLSPLLCSIAAGLVARNARTVRDAEPLIEHVQLPVLVVFFAAAGASLDLDRLAAVAPFAAALVALRAMLIVAGNRLAAGIAAVPRETARYLPFGLVSQAGVALGLAVIVGREFPGWGTTLEALCVAIISAHELVGPIALRWALQRAGEVRGHGQVDTSVPDASMQNCSPEAGAFVL